MSRYRKLAETANCHYRRKFKWLNRCVYCGGNVECYDHVFPISRAYNLSLWRESVKRQLGQGLNIVPACNSCNTLAGDKPFTNILEKRAHIQELIKKKYRKYLRTVRWDEDDLEDMGYTLTHEITRYENNRVELEARINWPNCR